MHEAVIKVIRRAARAARRRPPPEETEFITIVMTGEGIEVPLSADWMSRKLTYSTPSHSASGTRTAAPPMKMVLLGADGSRWYTKLLDHLDLLLANTHATGPDLTVEMTLQICTHCDMIYDGIRMLLLPYPQPCLH